MQEESPSKSPDPADLFVGVMEFIKKLFVRKRLFLSDKAYNSLFISMLLVFQIWLTLNYPAEAYFAPVVAFGYFLVHLVNKLLLERSDRDIIGLRDNAIAYNEIASKIEKCAISKPHEIIEIIKEYIKNKRFSEDIQIALFKEYGRYSFELRDYIERDVILKEPITAKAMGVFLSVSTLQDDFLKKLVTEYSKHNSFLFNLGRTQFYEFGDGRDEKKYYTAGYNFEKFNRVLQTISPILIIVPVIVIATIYISIYGSFNNIEKNYLVIYMILVIIYIYISVFFVNMLEKKKVKEVLENEQIILEEIQLEKFIDELNLKK
ncbi:MAG: hypothetical protein WCE94_01435 [Candidatus Methanoperedens sp.]